jgi:glycosyltransferase involved in cell wall biosynthesis
VRPIDACILFSTADWDAPYWTNKQHTARNLASKGIEVLYIESIGLRRPNIASSVDIGRIFRRLLRAFRGAHQVGERIYVLSPLIIPLKHHWLIVRWFNQVILSRSICVFIKRIQASGRAHNPIVWSYHPYALELMPKDGKKWPVIYHCVDDLSAVPGVDGKAFNQAEEAFLKHVDVVFTTSTALYEKCRPFSDNVYNFSNVVDFEHFSQKVDPSKMPLDLQSISHPRIIYAGVLSDFKIDFELLFEVIKLSPQWQFIFIGEEREGQFNSVIAKLKLQPNVHFLGYRKYADLPKYLASMDVAILPTLINSYTKSMFPMKYYEYISAGLPVVSTPLDFLQEHYEGVVIGHNAKTFKDGIEQQLNRGKLSELDAINIIGDNTWASRLDKMINCIEDLEAR